MSRALDELSFAIVAALSSPCFPRACHVVRERDELGCRSAVKLSSYCQVAWLYVSLCGGGTGRQLAHTLSDVCGRTSQNQSEKWVWNTQHHYRWRKKCTSDHTSLHTSTSKSAFTSEIHIVIFVVDSKLDPSIFQTVANLLKYIIAILLRRDCTH